MLEGEGTSMYDWTKSGRTMTEIQGLSRVLHNKVCFDCLELEDH